MIGPDLDTHAAQAERVADFLTRQPEATAAELAAACDLGCPSKVLSAMARELGYGMRRGWRWVYCASGTKRRHVRTYALTHRPRLARQLPLPLD